MKGRGTSGYIMAKGMERSRKVCWVRDSVREKQTIATRALGGCFPLGHR